MTKANSEVSIFRVLREDFGVDHPSEGRSYKGHCPFGYEHADGGIDKAWRTYPLTNSSYCFAMHGYMGPVRLMSMRWDVSSVTAARRLLERYGLTKPRHWRERWNEVSEERERKAKVGSAAYAAEALQVALTAHPAWGRAQYHPVVQQAMEEALEALETVLEKAGSEEAVRVWFERAQSYVTRRLDQWVSA